MNNFILLTGASGFLGKAALRYFIDRKISVRPVYRSVVQAEDSISDPVVVSNLDESVDWKPFLHNIGVVVHAAARAHIMKDDAADPLSEYRRINVQGTLNLARQSAAAGVKRFIFISSVKVNGESTKNGIPFKADDIPAPEDAYGVSKAEAEEGLQRISRESGMEIVIIRPVLIYGFGVKGNFANLVKIIRKSIPIPLGAVKNNKRSLVSLDNLLDLIFLCINHPNAANQIFLVSDGHDLSTYEMLHRISIAEKKNLYLIPVPVIFLSFAAKILGKRAVADRILGSLQVDIGKNYKLLGWVPPMDIQSGFNKANGNI